MSDAGRQPGSADWPPPVPSGIHLRPRTAVAPSVMPERDAPAPAPAQRWGQAPPEAGRVAAAQPEPPPATESLPPPTAESLPPPTAPPRPPADAPVADGPLLDPAGYRRRLVRDAAAALALVAWVVLVGSLLVRPAPTGDVLSATGAPGGAAAATSPSPAASSGPAPSPSPTAGTSARAEPVP